MTRLSVVLIAKNQEWNTARLIESVLDRTACVFSREVVLVDSASTDHTIEVASRYPITLLSLHSDQPLTPAAGRYVGYKYTLGDLVLFLDGDMELCEGWLEKALEVVQGAPHAGAVTGRVLDVPSDTNHKSWPVEPPFSDSVTEIRHGGGAALYRRSVLEEVGTFNPYLNSDEEPELCLRIRCKGYRVLRLDYPIAYHYSSPRRAFSTLVSRRKRNLYLGYGQAIRYHWGTGLLWPYLKERGYALVPGIWIVAGVIILMWSLIGGQWGWSGGWLLLSCSVVVGDAVRKRSFYQAIFSLAHRLFISEGTVRGLLRAHNNPTSYPCKLDVVKQADEIQLVGHE